MKGIKRKNLYKRNALEYFIHHLFLKINLENDGYNNYNHLKIQIFPLSWVIYQQDLIICINQTKLHRRG